MRGDGDVCSSGKRRGSVFGRRLGLEMSGIGPMKRPAVPTWKRLVIAWLFVPLHRLLFRLSGGRLLSRLEGDGVLILTTRGRRSGKRRSSPLLYFQFEGSEDLIVVASNYGQDHHPGWYLNLVAESTVVVQTKGERYSAEARVAEGEERLALFDRVVATNSRFATYRAGTDRRIPVVALRRL